MPSEVSVGNILFISIIGPHWNAETVTVPYPSISASFQVSLPHPRTSNNLCTLVNTHNSMHDFEIETSMPFLISVQVSFLCLDIFLNSAATLKKSL